MAVVACLWCETTLKPEATVCPECGLQHPAGDESPLSRGRRSVIRRSRYVGLVLIAVPLMLSAAFAARSGEVSFTTPGETGVSAAPAPTAPQPPAVYSDPLQRSVWNDGVKAVQQALAQDGPEALSGPYINVAAGQVVSFCGEVAGTSGYGSESGAQRFISIFGQAQSTILEGQDESFGVLWTRVCAPVQQSA